jgi:hypothetical protein
MLTHLEVEDGTVPAMVELSSSLRSNCAAGASRSIGRQGTSTGRRPVRSQFSRCAIQ